MIIPHFLGVGDRMQGDGSEIALKCKDSSTTVTLIIENKLTYGTLFLNVSHFLTGLCAV